MRAFKTVNDLYIEPISFTVPRRAETFQADIFPPAVGLRPAVSAKEWLDGKTGLPAKIDLESVYEGTAPKEVAADYQPPAPAAAPVAPKVEPKKEEPKEEPKPVVRAPPPSVSDSKSSIAAMANKYQDADEEEPKKEEPSSFDEEVKPVQRNPLPVRTESKPATPPAASPVPAPVNTASSVTTSTPTSTSAAATASNGPSNTSLTEIKVLIENQTKIISAQNDQIGLLTSEVESLKKRLGSGSQDQSERIRQLELELEEARS
jgi:coronin-1B/1C/6